MADEYRPMHFPDGSGGWDTVGDPRLGTRAPAVHDHTRDDISDASALGRTLMAVADAQAGRTALDITVDTSVGTRVFVGGVMVYGSTGWRDLRTILVNGWTGTVKVRRVNDSLQIHYYKLDPTAATDRTFINLPAGFGNIFSGVFVNGGDRVNPIIIEYSPTGRALRLPTDHAVYALTGYCEAALLDITDAWPQTLPGTPG